MVSGSAPSDRISLRRENAEPKSPALAIAAQRGYWFVSGQEENESESFRVEDENTVSVRAFGPNLLQEGERGFNRRLWRKLPETGKALTYWTRRTQTERSSDNG